MTQDDYTAEGNAGVSLHDALTASIVSAYVSNNAVPKGDLPELINSVRSALAGGQMVSAPLPGTVAKPTPAEIKKSITPDAIISFIDGRPYKTLKRHLAAHGLNPDSYRERFSLPFDYPLVAAKYAALRSDLAKKLQLGVPSGKRAA